MTNYIESMMNIAGVEKEVTETCYEFYKENNGIDIWNVHCRKYLADEINSCDVCPQRKFKEKLPDFTAEKQLEVIKLISSEKYLSTIEYDNGSRGFTVEYYQTDGDDSLICHVSHKDFPQALAQLTTKLMKAGELDKEKVKEILQ